MKWLRGFLFRLGGLFRRERRERELAPEMESHLQMHIEDNLRSGVESRAASAERGPADSCCGSCSRQATNQLNTFRCEAAGMTRRNAILDGHPLGFEQRGFGKAHENRVERAGLKFRFAAEFIPVAPGGWVFDEAFENAESLRGYSRNLHRNSPHIYIDIPQQCVAARQR